MKKQEAERLERRLDLYGFAPLIQTILTVMGFFSPIEIRKHMVMPFHRFSLSLLDSFSNDGVI
jgi:hypothetical protein